MRLTRTAVAITAALAAAPCAARAEQQITGAGSSFAAPIYGKWGAAARSAIGVALNYQAVGSGAGQNQVINRVVDFGASDAPVAAEKLTANRLVQFPTVMGAVDVIVNLPGIAPDELRLTGEVLADIYLGKISKWNDHRVQELNPGLKLPSAAIAPVYRADGSGTTFVFTDYLSAVSPVWKERVGSSTSVKWLAGSGARGSDGVAGTVHNVRGGIGYVESAYATQNHLTTTQLQNKDGQFVKPNTASFAAAAAAADWSQVQNFAIDLNNEPGAGSWPIVSATFVLVPANPSDPARGAAVIRFFDWAYANGDDIARGLNYVPLPAAVKDQVRKTWKAALKATNG